MAFLIASPKIGDDATIQAAGSETSDQPATNLQTMQPSEVWRATTLGSAYVEYELATLRTIDLVALLYHNGSPDAMVRVRAASTQADLAANPGYDSGPLMARCEKDSRTLIWTDEDDNPAEGEYTYQHFVLDLGGAGKRYSWWRADVIDAQNPDGYIEVGRLYLSAAERPGKAPRYGWGMGLSDGQQRTRAFGRQLFTTEKSTGKTLEMAFGSGSETDMWDSHFRLQRLRGTSKDVLVVLDTTKTARMRDWTVCGLLSDPQPLVNETIGFYQTSLTVEELIP
ncbi:MAG: hypothetical protein CMN85_10815 [Spongiibacteraceae bacterium]|uniref:hypothetical protein n=1 Tax=uncultured Haliea sp. TaxID=622616 RepID=UPI000C5A49B3|nr:hypothetical protein [Spongiibacteraceae bacterium]|tara:strand:+ start:8470 stop:9315 length:846 start_codon:yes stop_codon:yes gene_type:complete